MHLPTTLRRFGFRLAHALLRVYWFVWRPALSGVKCVLTDGNRVLLVRHAYGRREWDLPGGGIKRHEQPVSAARREMGEELGIWIEDWGALGEMWVSLDHRRGPLHCFHAELGSALITIDRGELAAARWFVRDDLPEDIRRYVEPILGRINAGEVSRASTSRNPRPTRGNRSA